MSNEKDKDDYPIGRGKPPKHSQFQKGQSGNPKGRPPGDQNFKTMMEEKMNEELPFTQDGQKKTASAKELIIRRALKKALEGDSRMLIFLINLGIKMEEEDAEAAAISISSLARVLEEKD